jgi:MFS family permease
MPFPRGLRALEHRDFRRFYAGQVVSLIGNWMQSVAQAWLVLTLTSSPFRLGLINALQFGPVLLLSLFAGAAVDRLPKRRLLVTTQVILAAQALALGLLVWLGHVQYWHVCVLATLLGVVNAFDMPVRQSFIHEMVGKADLGNAVALNSAGFNGARVVGPAVAGLVIGAWGVAPAFLINGASFAVVIAALLGLRAKGRPVARPRASMLADALEGVQYAVRTPRVRLILCLLAVVTLTVFNFGVFVPLLARDVLRSDARGFGFLQTALGVGAVGGALVLAVRGRERPPLVAIVGAAIAACLALIGLSTVGAFWIAAVILAVIGFTTITTVASCNTTLQLAAPDHLRGRVMSLYTLVFSGGFPIGALVLGAVAERWGVQRAMLVAGLAGAASLALLLLAATRGPGEVPPVGSGAS